MDNQISPAETRILGGIAFLLSVAPPAAMLVIFVAFGLGLPFGSRLFGIVTLVVIVSAGLQLPVYFVLAELAGDRVPESEKSPFKRSFKNPFYLFSFWWRYVRRAR